MKTPDNNISHYILTYLLPILLLLPLVISCGCGGSYRDDPRLRHIGESLSDPEISKSEALSLLDSLGMIQDKDLSEGERYYRDFLTIKASDKGYLRHTSDSLYLRVKDYFSSHHSNEMLAEVLYYGGRVYSDLGNYPVALQYFEEALDCMGDNPKDPRLKRRVLSQTGRLLTSLRLYDEAMPYVEESLKLGENLRDTLVQIYNLGLAGDISTRLKNYPQATQYFEEACDLSKGRYPTEYAINRFLLGDIAYQQGDFKTALPILKTTMDVVDSMRRNYVLPIAAQAYLKAGIVDTAYMYALELISNEDSLNTEIGYHVLLSDAIRGMIPVDTVAGYIRTYGELLDKDRNSNMDNAAILQHSFYNYSVHDRARQKAENSRDQLIKWLMVIGMMVGTAIIVILIYKVKKNRGETALYSTITKIFTLKNIKSSQEEASYFPENVLTGEGSLKTKLAISKDELKQQLMEVIEKENPEKYKSFLSKFRDSLIYEELIVKMEKSKSIENDGKIWNKLEKFLSVACPQFLSNLQVLSDSKLTEREKQTAILIKCGFRIVDVGKLLSKSKGTMVSRRDSISIKIFGEKKGTQYIDNLIKIL